MVHVHYLTVCVISGPREVMGADPLVSGVGGGMRAGPLCDKDGTVWHNIGIVAGDSGRGALWRRVLYSIANTDG